MNRLRLTTAPPLARRKRFRGNEPAQFKAPGKEGLGEAADVKN